MSTASVPVRAGMTVEHEQEHDHDYESKKKGVDL
jgi:hypothetical protein